MRASPGRAAAVALVVAALSAAAGCGTDGAAPATAAPTTAAASATATSDGGPARLGVRVLRRLPHDPGAFTQGLAFDGEGRLFESLGRYGRSAVRRVDPVTGRVLDERRLPDDRFGEGLAVGPDGLVQLTWREGEAFRWSLEGLDPAPSWTYRGEGWGLVHDPVGRRFVRSDGSATLWFHDPDDFAELGRLEVTRSGEAVDELNELELIDGVLYANVWRSEEILRIDPASGRVTGVVDASGLWDDPDRGAEQVLNGIAHRPGDPPGRLWLTGKEWPHLYEVELVELVER